MYKKIIRRTRASRTRIPKTIPIMRARFDFLPSPVWTISSEDAVNCRDFVKEIDDENNAEEEKECELNSIIFENPSDWENSLEVENSSDFVKSVDLVNEFEPENPDDFVKWLDSEKSIEVVNTIEFVNESEWENLDVSVKVIYM